MRCTVLILAFITIAYGSYIPVKTARDLGDDFQELLQIIPVERLQSILELYSVNDDEVRGDFVYFQSEKVDNLIMEIHNSEEMKNVYSYISEHGYTEIYDVLSAIHEFMGWPRIDGQVVESKMVRKLPSHRSWDDMVQALQEYFPLDEVKAFISDKLENSPDFKGLYDIISGEEFHEFAKRIYNEKSTQEIIKDLEGMNIHIDGAVQAIKDFLHWD